MGEDVGDDDGTVVGDDEVDDVGDAVPVGEDDGDGWVLQVPRQMVTSA